MKTNFHDVVLSVLDRASTTQLELADSKEINTKLSSLPWSGSDIDWKGENFQYIDFTAPGTYSKDSVDASTLGQFLALADEKTVLMFSAFEPPLAILSNYFIENWFFICSHLTCLPKLILVRASDLKVESPRIIEIDPMSFMKGHI